MRAEVRRMMIDIDNTICDTNGQIAKVNCHFNEIVYPFPLGSNFFEENPNVMSDASPIEGAADTLKNFITQGVQIYYVTARLPWAQSLTELWLRKHGFPAAEVIFTTDKRSIALSLGAQGCIEDAPHELNALTDVLTAWVPAKPYNQHFSNRFEHWTELRGFESLILPLSLAN